MIASLPKNGKGRGRNRRRRRGGGNTQPGNENPAYYDSQSLESRVVEPPFRDY